MTSFSESTVEPNISENLTSNEILKAGVAPEAGIDAVLLPLEEFVKTLPPYWLRLVNGTPILQTITDPDTGEVVPRASEAQKLTPVSIRKVTPGYVPREQKAEDF